MSTETGRELRALSDRIERITSESSVHSIAGGWVHTLVDHITAVARVHDMNAEKQMKPEKTTQMFKPHPLDEMLVTAVKIGEKHLNEKIRLRNMIEKAFYLLNDGHVEEARQCLRRALDEIG